MARNSRIVCLAATLIAAFLISGCQSASSGWSTAWKERTKPKPNFQGVEGQEEVTYWPNRSPKSNPKLNDAGQLKNKMAGKTGQSKRDAQLVELIREGDQLRKNSQYEDARLVYSKALTISPDNPDIHHRLAIVADKQHQTALADEHYQAALKVRPRDAKLLNDIGYSYFLRGDLKRAEITLKESLSIDNTNKIAMSNLGTIYAQQNRYPEALDMFRHGMSEAEAQQAVTMVFNQNQSMVASSQMTNQGHSNTGTIVTTKGEDTRDLSKMTQEQIQQEMARLSQEAKMRRMQSDKQSQALEDQRILQQQIAQTNPTSRMSPQGSYMAPGQPNGNAMSPMNNQQAIGGQQAMMLGPGSAGQMNALAGNNPQAQGAVGAFDNSQMANGSYQNPGNQMALAMNGTPNDRSMSAASPEQTQANGSGGAPVARIIRGSGLPSQQPQPGNPQMQQGWDQRASNPSNNPASSYGISGASQMATQLGMSTGPGMMFPVMQSQEADNAMRGNQGIQRDSRSGFDNQRSPDSFSNPNGFTNSIEQTSNRGGTNFSEDPNGPSITPMSPVNNWSSPSMGTIMWQSDTKSNWSNETLSPNGQGSNSSFQNGGNRLNGIDGLQSAVNSNPSRTGNEMSRPYNGTWPNSNSLPQRPNPSISITGRSPETLEMMGINAANESNDSSYQNPGAGSAQGMPTNSLPMYPYAPNR